ncbi:MAG: glycosyltransferase family 4 protein [Clostridiales bacterium]|nr:glycosyltransferase family 4 protein [Clostridiales bacterium]
MKILHLCLGSFFPDNYSYQENMLPKFHKKLGFDVEVIASTQTFDEFGKTYYLPNAEVYFNEYNIKVTRLLYKSENCIWKKLKRYKNTYKAICDAAPDIIFIHGGQFLDVDQVVKYLKSHSNVTVYVDNHADFSNSATNWISKNILHKLLWKYTENLIEPYTKKFYGVLPVRVNFLKDIYGLPAEKCELLVMGADDEYVEKSKLSGARELIRKKYGIKEDDFLIMSGGKIDQWKTQTLLLMQAVHNISRANVKLIVFGSVTQELTEQVRSLSDGIKVQYIGWILSKDSYDYFEAADLVVFPGRHSVMWEQVTGQGKPMIVKDWPGTHHIDLGGNVKFLTKDSAEVIQKEIEDIIDNPEEFEHMKAVAQEKGMLVFSYKEISKRAIGIN